MKELYLIYVHEVGIDANGKNIYEFIFTDDLSVDVSAENWDSYPASSSNPQVPNERFIKEIGKLETKEIKLDVIQKSDTFCLFDAMDQIINLAYENIDDYEVYPKKRLGFMFGETIEEVKNKLYEKDLILDFKYEKIKK